MALKLSCLGRPRIKPMPDNRISPKILTVPGMEHPGGEIAPIPNPRQPMTKEVKELIKTLTSNQNKTARIFAAKSLGRLKNAHAIPALAKVMLKSGGQLCRACAWALGEIGNRRALPALYIIRRTRGKKTTSVAVSAMAKIESRYVWALNK